MNFVCISDSGSISNVLVTWSFLLVNVTRDGGSHHLHSPPILLRRACAQYFVVLARRHCAKDCCASEKSSTVSYSVMLVCRTYFASLPQAFARLRKLQRRLAQICSPTLQT